MKKRMKALLSVVMVLVLTLGVFAGVGFKGIDLSIVSSAEEREEQDREANWVLYKDGELVIYEDIPVSKDGGAPWYNYSTSVKSVTIGGRVTTIYPYTFQECSSLTAIFIPANVSSVSPKAFEDCTGLAKIYYEGSRDEWKGITSEVYDKLVVFNHKHDSDLKTEARRAVTATCKNSGYTGDVYCVDCGAFIREGKKVDQLKDHVWSSSYVVLKSATCSEPGEKGRQCTVCGTWDSNSITKIPATGVHVYDVVIKIAGNCDSKEGATYKVRCETCNKFKDDKVQTSKKHVVEDTYYAPTCTLDGGTHSECKYCNAYSELKNITSIIVVEKENDVEVSKTVMVHQDKDKDGKDKDLKLGHDDGKYITLQKATCVTDGEQVLVCKRCGEEIGERKVIKKLGHIYSDDFEDKNWEVINEATCTEPGNRVYTCPRCDEELGINIPELGIVCREDLKPEERQYYNLSSLYNASDDADEQKVIAEMIKNCRIPYFHEKLGEDKKGNGIYNDCCSWKTEGTYVINDYVQDITAKPATCSSTGLSVLVCSKCNKAVSNGEKWSAKAITKTIEKNPKNHVQYSGYSYTGSTYKDLNGGWVTATTTDAPVCKKAGKLTQYCSGCGEKIGEKEDPALDHVWKPVTSFKCQEVDKTKGMRVTYKCELCGNTEERNVSYRKNHEFKEVVTKEATCTESGMSESKCIYCGTSEQDYDGVIPAKVDPKKDNHAYTKLEAACVEATCFNPSKTVEYCKDCGKIKVTLGEEEYNTNDSGAKEQWKHNNEKFVEKNSKETTVAPNCEDPGMIVTTCTKCSKIVKEEVDSDNPKALGHKFVVDAKVTATCQKAGKTEGKHCERCDKVIIKQRDIPKKDHAVVTVPGYPATCVAEGMTDKKYCSICGDVFQDSEVIPPTSDAHVIKVFEAVPVTCTEDGYTEGKYCTACNTWLAKQEVIRSTGHKSNGSEEIISMSFAGFKVVKEFDCVNCKKRVTEETKLGVIEWIFTYIRFIFSKVINTFTGLFTTIKK